MEDDAIVVIDEAPYPIDGEARLAAAEAMGEDREGGASVVPPTTMTTEAMEEDGDGGAPVMPTTKGGGRGQGCQCRCYDKNDNNHHN